MTTPGESVVAIVEYGATARGDADAYSDRDICVWVEDIGEYEFEAIRTHIAREFSCELRSVSCYRLSTVDEMVQNGSLFLLHLRLEGRVLIDPDGIAEAALSSLAPYVHFQRDVERFRDVFNDVVDEYNTTGELSVFELHVLSIVARNICMLMTVRCGSPAFGRRAVLGAARACHPDLPMSDSVWNALMNGHLRFMRDVVVTGEGKGSGPMPSELLDTVQGLLGFAAQVLG
jgi:predicted nucleotidyltransferase